MTVSHDLDGRPATITFSPTRPGPSDDPVLGLFAEVRTHYRIPLVFYVYFTRADGAAWQLHSVRSKQSGYLASVQVMREPVADHAGRVLADHLDELRPVVTAARELLAARVLTDAHQARTDMARARRREERALAVISDLGLNESRATEVRNQLVARARTHPYGL
ncbi:hypothetical protein [Streptomyces sp. WM6378]|uniref:hypothetical protein n=1 Tax=Streptomyces sp. WM6378 TaxID=1415557 RepID=UPI0006B04795|nr:hypothetical protein [Streptomyces sp. WM6378]KOU43602.1 hypothetical protein ADK54_17590 [Streptomyces sp. WM6378]